MHLQNVYRYIELATLEQKMEIKYFHYLQQKYSTLFHHLTEKRSLEEAAVSSYYLLQLQLQLQLLIFKLFRFKDLSDPL